MLNTMQRRTFAHSPFAALDEFMNLVSREVTNGSCCGGTAPALALDIRERPEEIVIDASVPGFKRNEIDVQVHDGLLSITATREKSEAQSDEHWIRRERTSTSFARQIRLPDGVAGDGVKAELADGVLTVRVPKPAQLQPRKIEIA